MKAIILAAGKGKRMNSKTLKVLHKLMGKPLLKYVTEACQRAGVEDITVVIGPESDAIKESLPGNISFTVQERALGTGSAVMSAKASIGDGDDVLVLHGDMPLVTPTLIKGVFDFYQATNADGVVTAISIPDSPDLGRVFAGANDAFEKIVEHKDLEPGRPVPDLVNAGVYMFKGSALLEGLNGISNDNKQNEYYLTDVPAVLKNSRRNVRIYRSQEPLAVFTGINNQAQLAEAAAYLRGQINKRHMENGVQMLDPSSVYIDDTVEISGDVLLYPGVILEGGCKIDEGSVIGPNTRLINTTVGKESHIQYSVLSDAIVGSETEIGPFAFLRPGAVIGDKCRVGDFVEVKNSNIGRGTKIAHLGYVGDSDVGECVNWGCGAITANYDGKVKRRSTVKNGAFIGCNSNLVSPVTVGESAYVAAGSTITDDVPDNALAIARGRQAVKPGWAKARRSGPGQAN